eukprot:6783607-Prymnesium_polylepis.2
MVAEPYAVRKLPLLGRLPLALPRAEKLPTVYAVPAPVLSAVAIAEFRPPRARVVDRAVEAKRVVTVVAPQRLLAQIALAAADLVLGAALGPLCPVGCGPHADAAARRQLLARVVVLVTPAVVAVPRVGL